MNEIIKSATVIISASVMMSANAQDFFAVQQQMQQLEALNKIGANIQESIDLGGKCTRACSRGDWSEAVRYSRRLCEISADDRERVVNYTQLAILCWNDEEYSDAVSAVNTVIRSCRNIEEGCEANARKFKRAIVDRKIGGKFSVEEATTLIGVWDAVVAVPNAIVQNRLNNLIAYCDGETRRLRHEGAMMEKAAKRKASAEYWENTRKTFDPDDPPSRGTTAREHWDVANRVYQIFE